jgi:serine/threonine-protein kinase
MNERPDLDSTVDEAAPDPLNAALAAAFGPDSGPPLPATASVVRALGAIPVQLREPATEPVSPAERPDSPDRPAPDPSGRLQVHGEIARGGMGAVFKGRDTELGRDVAVKVLLEAHQGRTELVQRFVEEAQVAGQLQHPGVVPVYEMGQFPDRRPYFTMKLVKGRTLAALLAEHRDPSQDRPRLLKVFEQVCQAVAYAHARGVIHRDLKPSNVMVGAFGEVQVMDWGLAKVLSRERQRPEPEPTSVIRTARSSSDTPPGAGAHTAAGQVMGTPAYMAPEQARGEVDRLDARCDVFGLGALLCQILTGRPPYVGSDSEEVQHKATAADLADAFARLDGCGADAELTALAKRCLAAEREDRPRDAEALAAELNAYLESVEARLRQAELERAAAQARAVEERKRRRVSLALAAAVLLLLAGGGGGVWWAQQQRQARAAEAARRRQEADGEVHRAMGDARLLLEQARAEPLGDLARFREARAAARRAQDLARAGAASEEVQRQASDLAALLEAEQGAAERDRELLAALLEVRGPREGPAYQRDDKGSLVELAEPSTDEQFAAAFRAWGLDVDGVPTAEAAPRLKGRPPAVVMEVIAALDEWAGERRRIAPPGKWQPLAQLAAALDDPQSRQAELRALLTRDRLGQERALGVLAVALRPVPVPFDAGSGGDRARLRQLAEQANPATEPVLGLLTLARALQLAGEDALAERLLRAALRSRPREVILHAALGRLLTEQRPPRWLDAVECYAVARALRPELGEALANALVRGGRVGEGLALYERLAAERPDNPWLHLRHGYALGKRGRYKEAEAVFRAALRLQPDDPVEHCNLGVTLSRQGRPKEAEAEYRAALRLRPDFPQAHNNLGALLCNVHHRYAEAEAEHREALRLQPDEPLAHYNLGGALSRQGRYPEAEAEDRAALRLRPDFPEAHYNLGLALGRQGRYNEAEAAYRAALRLRPDWPEAHCNLGLALREQGRFAEALASLRRGHQLGSKTPGWRYPSAAWVRRCERLVEMESRLPALLRGDTAPASASECAEFASVCRTMRLYATAARLYADAFDDLPSQPRYDAARSAALAAAGRGEDARALPDKEVVRLRRQALSWLRAELALLVKRAAGGDTAAKQTVRERVQHWQQDADLAAVRDKEALDKLPDGERDAWRQLWADVADLLKKVEEKPR